MSFSVQSVARDCLLEILDESRQPRKVFADAIDCDEALLSKKLNGTNGRDFGLGEFERLPRDIQVQFLKRYGKWLGLTVRELDYGEIAEEIYQRFEELVSLLKLARVSKPQLLKAGLTEKADRRVG